MLKRLHDLYIKLVISLTILRKCGMTHSMFTLSSQSVKRLTAVLVGLLLGSICLSGYRVMAEHWTAADPNGDQFSTLLGTNTASATQAGLSDVSASDQAAA